MHLPVVRAYLPLLLLLVGSRAAFGQAINPILTNITWLDSVQHLPLPRQVAAVRARAWRDTLVALRPPLGYLIKVTDNQRKKADNAAHLAQLKPIGFPLMYVLDEQPYFNNDATTVSQFQRGLAARYIQQVTLLQGVKAAAIYGSRAANGVVILSSKATRHF